MRALTPPLLILCLVALVTGCQKQAISLNELQSELEDIKTEASQAKKLALSLKHQFQALTDSVEKLDEELTAARLSTREAADQRSALETAFASYRKQYRDAIQQRAPGMRLASFVTATGSYTDVRVSQLDSWQVAIQHKDGFVKIDLADLPDNLRQQLGYDPSVGPKPAETAAVNVYVPTSPVMAESATTAAPTTAPAPRPIMTAAPALASAGAEPPCPVEARQKTRAEEAQRRYGDGAIISVWGGSGGGSGSTIKSTPQPLPQGYKPIGSSFSGSAMDQAYKDKKKAR